MPKIKKQNSLRDKQEKLRLYRSNFCQKKDEISRRVDGRENYFKYSNLSKREPDFCPLFRKGKICHDINPENLLCWDCYCSDYDIEYIDEKQGLLGRCRIKSSQGKYTRGIWDCSDCILPHV